MKSILTQSVALLSLVACVARVGDRDAIIARSSLAEVRIDLPSERNLQEFFGANCLDAKLNEQTLQRLGTRDLCEALKLLLSEYHLVISAPSCSSGVVPTYVNETNRSDNNVLEATVRKGCRYDVLLEMGQISLSQVYYSNQDASRGIFDVEINAPDRIPLKLHLLPTEAGLALGLSRDSAISTTDAASIDIEVGFGRRSTPSPTQTPNRANPGAVITGGERVSFDTIRPILRSKCSPCHASGGRSIVFVDRESDFKAEGDHAIELIQGREMPPRNSGLNLSEEERNLLLRFLRQS
jgi:hypothetical protein